MVKLVHCEQPRELISVLLEKHVAHMILLYYIPAVILDLEMYCNIHAIVLQSTVGWRSEIKFVSSPLQMMI